MLCALCTISMDNLCVSVELGLLYGAIKVYAIHIYATSAPVHKSVVYNNISLLHDIHIPAAVENIC